MLECVDRGAEVGLHELDPDRGRGRAEADDLPFDEEARNVGAEALVQYRLFAPGDRQIDLSIGRRVASEQTKEFAEQAIWRPNGHRDFAAAAADAGHLRRSLLGIGSEDRAEGAHDDVERFVRESKGGGVAFLKIDVQTFGGRAQTGALQHGWRDIDAGHGGSAAGGGEGCVAGGRADIEHAVAREDRDGFAEKLADYGELDTHLGEVAGSPGLLLELIQLLDVHSVEWFARKGRKVTR